MYLPFKFSPTAKENPPEPPDWVRWAFSEEDLTREQKNQIAFGLYGNFSNGTAIYKQGGWSWDLRQSPHLTRYLVRFKNGSSAFYPYYAADKTALRYILTDVAEIIEAPPKK